MTPIVDHRYALGEAAIAYQRMHAAEQMGKLVLENTR